MLNRYGIACLSEHKTNMLMWSYYAEGHTGIALRFDMSRDHMFPLPPILIKVRYRKDFPNLDYYLSSDDEQMYTVFGTKADSWSHEAEWRIVVRRTGYVQVRPELISGIIFGLRTPKESEEVVRRWIKERTIPTALMRVEHEYRSFELKVVPA